jgi:hypothetical protein
MSKIRIDIVVVKVGSQFYLAKLFSNALIVLVKLMKKPLSALVLLVGLLLAIESTSAQTWTMVQQGHSAAWAPLTMSADGSKLAVVLDGGAVLISTNSSVDWILSWPGSTNGATLGIASSADGNSLIVASGGAIIISTNSGATWTNTGLSYNPNSTQHPAAVALSADGSKLLVAINASFPLIYVSDDSGNTWNVTTNTTFLPPGSSGWPLCSADGTKMAVINSDSLSTSTNAGADWQFTGLPSPNISEFASTADGSKLFLLNAASPGWLFVSTNWGASWSSNLVSFSSVMVFPAGGALACSADGSRLVAFSRIANSGSIYTSTDSGLTWTSNSGTAGAWMQVASSADGNKLLAVKSPLGGSVSFSGGIFGTQFVPKPQLSPASAGNGLRLSWIVPSTNFVLQENSDLTTANWVTLSNMPTLNLSNLNNEVVLAPSNSSSFFRLMAY